MTFEQWSQKKNIQHHGDLQNDASELYNSDTIFITYPDGSYIYKIAGGFMYSVLIGSAEEDFNNLHDAERYLWENWSYSNTLEGS